MVYVYICSQQTCIYTIGMCSYFNGEMAEWSKAAVLKTVEGTPLPGFESLSLRQTNWWVCL